MRLAVLGTGTGVGKTTWGCALGQALQAAGVPTLGLKPVETGFPPGSPDPAAESDAAQLERAMFHVQHPRPHPLYALPEPVSPHLAAQREGTTIDLPQVATWVAEAERAAALPSRSVTLIETPGGAFTPIAPPLTSFDLALALAPELLVLVAANRLGVLHDVAATTRAMQAAGREPDALVLSASSPLDASSDSNPAELRRVQPALPVFVQPAVEADPNAFVAWLAQRLPPR